MRSPLSTFDGRGGNGWFMLGQSQSSYVPFFPPFLFVFSES